MNFKKSITETFEFFEFIHLICDQNEKILMRLWLLGNKQIQYYLVEYTTKFNFYQDVYMISKKFYNNTRLWIFDKIVNKLILQKKYFNRNKSIIR